MSEQLEVAYALEHGGFSFGVELDLRMAGITGVFGASGAGKTTLLRCIAGLEKAAHGRLIVAGEVWEDTERGLVRPPHAREIAYVFQEPRLFDHLSVQQNLDYGLKRRSVANEAVTSAGAVELLGLEKLLQRSPIALSGGEAQRVAIARALLRGPRIMLMDEPLASLDRRRKDEVLPFFDRLHAELAIPILYVSHDMDEVCRLCDRLVVLEEGRVAAADDLQVVLSQVDPPLVSGAEACAVIDTKVIDYDAADDMTRLVFSGGEFLAPGRVGAADKLRLRIKANDVSLCRARPERDLDPQRAAGRHRRDI